MGLNCNVILNFLRVVNGTKLFHEVVIIPGYE